MNTSTLICTFIMLSLFIEENVGSSFQTLDSLNYFVERMMPTLEAVGPTVNIEFENYLTM